LKVKIPYPLLKFQHQIIPLFSPPRRWAGKIVDT